MTFGIKRQFLLSLLLIIDLSASTDQEQVIFELDGDKPSSYSYKKTVFPYVSPARAKITKAIFPAEPGGATQIPNYRFNYAVSDPFSGDYKSQQELRQGDVVYGSYAFLEPDGFTREVRYTVDRKNGFNAVVTRRKS